MPIYEYECTACDKVFELQQRMSDEPLKCCPECEGEVRKLVSVSSFQLKGSGWFTDGYSGSSNGKGTAESKKESTAPTPCQGGAGGCKSCPAAAA